MKDISLLELLKSGAHFGHNTSRWNPKMKQYIFATRGDIHILDLEKTKQGLLKAAQFAKETTSKGGTILFVGTKKQTRELLKKSALSCNMPFVNIRWLGGTFTNFKTIQKTIRKLEKLENLKASGDLQTKYTKKEALMIEREIEKLKKLFEGITNLKKLPDAIFVTGVKHENIAIKEANKSKVKTIGIVDTNASPDGVDFVIPCNDDATKAVEMILNFMAAAISEGRAAAPVAAPVQN
ncbi:MAG: 30S ribosomal protein S2 [Candidatus Doudnabacteria bacterium]|nr:30S ribosomal protein S2 [Candidatus Doudnabacteria bacterium]